jgi:2-hydroxy-3-oxopropionate reductase
MITKETPVGLVGLGVIGGAMARNLLKAGFKLTVHNRSPAKVEELLREGAQDGGSPAGVARASGVVLLCLPDTPDVERVLFGEDGVAEGIERDAVVIDCSTVSATSTVDFARRLAKRGAHMLDSPVSGGPKGAQDGTLSCMIGGEADIVERCMPVFQAIGKTFTHIGANGSGQACKSCSALVLAGTLMAVSEAFTLAKKLDQHRASCWPTTESAFWTARCSQDSGRGFFSRISSSRRQRGAMRVASYRLPRSDFSF